jgi:acetyl-CoA synthetase
MATEERDLEVLLKTEDRFPPPPEFAEQANANDPAIYEEAERDFEAWWAGWAKELDWFEVRTQVDYWNPPWAQGLLDGKLNVAHICI